MGHTISLCQFQSLGSMQNMDSYQQSQQLSQHVIDHNNPPILQSISDLITVKKPFHKQLTQVKYPKQISHNNGLYIGDISQFRRPNGWGKYYVQDGSVVIGQFSNGQVEGKFFMAYPNTSYYHGQIYNGKITCENGQYYSPQFQYIGGFKNSLYHGKGKIIRGKYIIEGNWINGQIQSGKLQWTEPNGNKYSYTGQFNQDIQMHGNGTLKQPFGTYKGEFMNNKKHGQGEYMYNNFNKYKGEYRNGLKTGHGILYSRYDQVLYDGEWENNMPVKQDKLRVSQIVIHGSTRGLRRKQTLIRTKSSVSTENGQN